MAVPAGGAPALLIGIVVLGVLTDRPELANWLTADEKQCLARLLSADGSLQPTQARTVREGLWTPTVWWLGLLYFALLIGLYGFNFWLPQIVQGLGAFPHRQIGLLTMLPNLVAVGVIYGWGTHSDAAGERRWHLAVPALSAALGLVVVSQTSQPVVALAALTLAGMGIYGTLPVFWTLPTTLLTGAAAAGGIAMINAVGSVGGYLGSSLMGISKDAFGNYSAGLAMLALSMAVGGLLALRV
jgi:ACS family tartrate transporter-like MFS transporter